jgi:tetratricopeptide (TPR) repeat protein
MTDRFHARACGVTARGAVLAAVRPAAPSVAFLVFLLAGFALLSGCSGKKPAREDVGLAAPPPLDEEAVGTASALADSGYALLEAGRNEDAVAVFEKAKMALPEGRWGDYNLACAYARSGNAPKAFEALDAAVASGWDDAGHMESDPDLEPLRSDSRFKALLEQARATRGAKLAAGARGGPPPAPPRGGPPRSRPPGASPMPTA